MGRLEKNAASKKTNPPWKKEGSKIRNSVMTDSWENGNASSKKGSLLTFWEQEVLPWGGDKEV